MRITVLGLGAMGQRMAARLLDAGFAVTVWNRDAAKAAPLIARSAAWGETPADAVMEAEVVISMLRDDEASRRVWLASAGGALQALPAAATVIESSTLTPGWVRELGAAVSLRGNGFLDAPVVGSRPQADNGALVHLVGGEAPHLARVLPVLSALGSSIHHLGPVGSGMAMKLLVNMLFGTQVAVAAEALGWARRQGLDPQLAGSALGALPVCSPAMRAAVDGMLSRSFAPLFPVALAEKDIGYFVAEARRSGAQAPLAGQVQAVLRKGAQRGMADMNLTAVALLYE